MAKLWAGLDIGAETTSICVIDDAGNVVRERDCATEKKPAGVSADGPDFRSTLQSGYRSVCDESRRRRVTAILTISPKWMEKRLETWRRDISSASVIVETLGSSLYRFWKIDDQTIT